MRIFLAFVLLFSTLFSQGNTIKDMAGNEINLPQKVEKIAALWHANNQIILILGGADKIVASTDKIKQNAWFSRIYPRILSVPASLNGEDIQIEELFKLNPDVVIVSNKNYKNELIKYGFNAVLATFRNYDEMKKSILLTANVIGDQAPKKAQNFIDYFDENIKTVSEKTANIKEKPSVLHIVNGTNLLRVDGTKTIIDEWIKLAGGQNAIKKDGNMIEITIEEILNANPDVIIVGGQNAAASVDKIYKSRAYSGIKAVQEGRVYANPSGVFSWDRYGAESALQILWAAKTLHPELFKDLDIATKTKEFYKKFLGYDLNDAEFEYILKGLSPKGE